MKVIINILFLTLGSVGFAGNNSTAADGGECNPVAKYYCACENITHGAYYQISFMKLDFATGEKSVLSALKPFNLPPIFRQWESESYRNCMELLRQYPECL